MGFIVFVCRFHIDFIFFCGLCMDFIVCFDFAWISLFFCGFRIDFIVVLMISHWLHCFLWISNGFHSFVIDFAWISVPLLDFALISLFFCGGFRMDFIVFLWSADGFHFFFVDSAWISLFFSSSRTDVMAVLWISH